MRKKQDLSLQERCIEAMLKPNWRLPEELSDMEREAIVFLSKDLHNKILNYSLSTRKLTPKVTTMLLRSSYLDSFVVPRELAANFQSNCFECLRHTPNTIRTLSLRGCVQLLSDQLVSISKFCSNFVEELDVSYNPKLIGSEIEDCCKNMTKLKVLVCERLLKVKRMKICSSSLRTLISRVNSNMEEISFSGTSSLTSVDFRGCASLKKILLDEETQLSSLQEICFAGCLSLESLDFFRNVPKHSLQKINFWNATKLKNEDFSLIMEKFNNLVELYLTSTNIDESSLQKISAVETLKTLCINSCPNLSEYIATKIVTTCLKMEVIRLPECLQDDSAIFISENCPNLDTVDLSLMPRLSEQSALAFISNCERLRWLSLVDIKLSQNLLDPISDLRRPVLNELNVSFCGVRDGLLINFVNIFQNLLNLDLSGNEKLTDLSTKVMFSTLKKLNWISLSGCSKITFESLLCAKENKMTIMHIDLFGLKLLSLQQVLTFVSKLKNLKELNVEPSIKDRVIEETRKQGRFLKITCSSADDI